MTYKRWKLLRLIILGPFFAFIVLLALFSLGYAFLLPKGMMSGHSMFGSPYYVLRFESQIGSVIKVLLVPVVGFELASGFLMRRRKQYEDTLSITILIKAENTWPPAPTAPQ